MNLSGDETGAILAKSLSLIERTLADLDRIDHWHFPTTSSRLGVEMLRRALEQLSKPANLVPVDSPALYSRLFAVQELVEILERSSSDRISWPLVSYCDEIWRTFFGDQQPKLFYTLTREHNYSILRFTEHLRGLLDGLLPAATVDSVIRNEDLYCLELSSTEDANLPLYANIGHEFGHAIFDYHVSETVGVFRGALQQALDSIHGALQAGGGHPSRPTIRKDG